MLSFDTLLTMDEPTSTKGDVLAGRYELIESIGRGGFGVVFRARQLNMDREVAIKMLPAAFMTLPDIVDRFKREAKLTSRLSHPNTITVHDYGQHGSELFIVMELLRGEDLADLLKVEHTLAPERIISIASQILKSLGEATVGTPVYMSPEQAAGEQVTPATDLYALGVLMYEMACGRPPFQFDNPVKTMRAHLFDEVPALTDPALRGTHLERVILRALAKEPRLRHANAREFLDDLLGRAVKSTIVPVDLEYLSETGTSKEFLDAFEEAQTTELDDESESELLGTILAEFQISNTSNSRNITASYSNSQSTPLYNSAQKARSHEGDVPTRRERYRTPTGSSTSSILRIVALPANEQPDESDVIVLTQAKREGTKLEHSVRPVSIIEDDLKGDGELEEGVVPEPSGSPHQGDWSFGDLGASREAVRLVESGAHPVIKYDEDGDGDIDYSSRTASFVLLALFVLALTGCAALAWSQGLLG